MEIIPVEVPEYDSEQTLGLHSNKTETQETGIQSHHRWLV